MRSTFLFASIAIVLFVGLVPSVLAIEPLMEGCPPPADGSPFSNGNALVAYYCQTIDESEPIPNGGFNDDSYQWYLLSIVVIGLHLVV